MHIIIKTIESFKEILCQMRSDCVYTNCSIATMDARKSGYGLIENAAIALQGGRVSWLGPELDLPTQYSALQSEDLEGKLITPALIDCHTHMVFGGNRAREFEMRLNGASYEEIAKSGGGSLSTVNATREASDDQLLKNALVRLDNLIAEGVRVVEVKSGYGLTIGDEIRMLRVAKELEKHRPVKIVTTWLAAHAVPPEYKGSADRYVDEVVIAGLKQAVASNLVDAVDGFCESIAFSADQIAKVFTIAQELDIPVKLHAEQLTSQRGALTACKFKALSVDHLEYLPEEDVPSLLASDTVAVMLPVAFYTLNEIQRPPIEAFRQHGVPMAVATDCNPGSSPTSSILLAMNMACTQFAMTPLEALIGTTRAAAKALGLDNPHGQIRIGDETELAIWNVKHPAELSYWMGASPLYKLVSKAKI